MPHTVTMVKGFSSEVAAPLVAAIAHPTNAIAPSATKVGSPANVTPDPNRAPGQEI